VATSDRLRTRGDSRRAAARAGRVSPPRKTLRLAGFFMVNRPLTILSL